MHVVILSEQAIADLTEIARWIAGEAGQGIAHAYVDRIQVACMRLADFPHRGTPRYDLGADIRTLAFERRYLILYRAMQDTVEILRVISSAQDIPAQFDA